jgi:hypothetical protein
MRARAMQRAPAFDVPALRDRWLAFFQERVAPAFVQWKAGESSPLRRYPWYFGQLIAEGIGAKRFRALVRRECAAMGPHPSAPAAGFEPSETFSLPAPRPVRARAVAEDAVKPPAP